MRSQSDGKPPRARLPLIEEITTEIASYIRANNLAPGGRLPAISELADTFRVAPTTVREALRRLEAVGLVEVHHGVGVFVRSDVSRLKLLNPVRRDPDNARLLALVDARLLIEPTLAERAALHVDQDSVDELTKVLDKSGKARKISAAESDRLNMDFHLSIARVAGNHILTDILQTFVELYLEDQIVIGALYEDYSRDHAEHLEILNAIKAGNGPAARSLMSSHLAGVIEAIERRGT
jgi:GntR family transcriptional regulator, transcriptional repressor for pyruvate dehydrogenase complex